MKKRIIILLIILISLPSLAQDQPIKDDPRIASAFNLLELWLDAQCAYNQIPGISMGVVHDQELLWCKGFGVSDLKDKNPTTTQTIHSICSISKLFTSIAVMQLRDRGLLHLDDPVGKHLPWFNIEQIYPDGPAATVKGLLTHSSGLPRESDFPYWTAPNFDFPTREQIIERLSKQKTLYPADTYFQYSNLGLSLAGEIVTHVSGQPFAEYIQEHILDHLGMKDTRTSMPDDLRGGRLATGYGALARDGKRHEVPPFQACGIAPAAGFSSTVEDLARFASWQFRLLEDGAEEILDANTLREMHRVHWVDPDWETHWGLGFSTWRFKDKTFVGHGGSCPGYRTQIMLQSQEKFAAIFMANASGINTRMYTQRAYEITAPAIAEAIKSPDTAKQPDPDMLKYTGTYSSAPWGGETAVLIWKDKLVMVYFPTDNPLESMTKLKHIEGDTFRRIRDDEELGEKIVFETDSDGNVTRLKRHSNYYPKVR